MENLETAHEELLNVVIDGTLFEARTESWLQAHYPDQAADLIAGALAQKQDQDNRDRVRSVIKRNIGDTASLLGTTADAAQLSVAVILADIVAMETTTTFAAYKTAKMTLLSALAGDDLTGNPVDIPALAQGLITKIQSGEIKLTASVKGLVPALDEIMARATGVAEIMIEATGGQTA